MKGVQIFLHSLKQVLGNLPGAIKVSALPYAVQFVVSFFLTRPDKMAAMSGDPMAMMEGGPSLVAQLLSLVVVVLTSVWIAVAWHRYILKNEVPAGFVPPIHKDRMIAYFVRALLIGLLMIVVGFVLGFIAALVGGAVGMATGSLILVTLVFALLVYFPIFVIAYRISTSLPASAVTEDAGSFMAGWDATKGENGTFIGLGLVSAAVMFLNGYISISLLSGVLPLFIIWTLVFNWLAMMVGLSVLTTLYGHFVEKRALV